eukprot:gene2518-6805_t
MAYLRDVGNGTDPVAKGEALRLIRAVPLLSMLQGEGIISVDNVGNCIYAYRTREQQVAIAQQKDGNPHYPSGAFKFKTINSAEEDPGKYNCWHGNISGKMLGSICKNGLRGYRPEAYSVVSGTSRAGDTLVTPSWILALECYGFEHKAADGTRYRIALKTQVRKSADIRRGKDTFNRHAIDWIVPHHTMEWSVPVGDVQVTGVVVKQYHQAVS